MDKKAYDNGIKVMRLGKPIEHLQAALQATFTSGPIGETVTTIARQLSYSCYLTFDAIVWVSLASFFVLSQSPVLNTGQAHSIKFVTLSPEAATKVAKRAFQFWFAGIAFSLVNGVFKVSSFRYLMKDRNGSVSQAARLAKETKSLQESKVWGEKDLAEEAARETRLSAVEKSVLFFLCNYTSHLFPSVLAEAIVNNSQLTCLTSGSRRLAPNSSTLMRVHWAF